MSQSLRDDIHTPTPTPIQSPAAEPSLSDPPSRWQPASSFEHLVSPIEDRSIIDKPYLTPSPSNRTLSTTAKMIDLDKPDRVKYLSVIDKIRGTGVTGEISLPQLVVVGDQSSGKSSLLEGITGLAFPVSGDICTRFATQIIVRRCAPHEAAAKVSIIPGPTSADDEEAKQHLDAFKRTIDTTEFEDKTLGNILSQASVHLGLPDAGVKLEGEKTPEKRFSDDIVSIELSGPDQHHLSVVDVPGLFHNPTKLQTAEDKGIIRSLVKRYVGEKRTIILAVCNALSNLASQEVFQLARDADPEGQRTVGIVTKCDVVQEGDEKSVLEIATNRYQPLKHGWFVVKNRSTKDILEGVTVPQRHAKERDFFDNTAPWNTITKDRRGVSPLKDYLGKLLSSHIRSELPGLLRELKDLRDSNLGVLDQLGDPRQTSAQQRRFLGDIAARYEKRVQDALENRPDRHARENPSLKLRKNLRDLDDDFEKRMRTEGHTYAFRTVEDDIDEDYTEARKAQADESSDDESSDHDIYRWIRQLYLENRGVELPGMINPDIVRIIFQEQTIAWEDIAVDYFDKVLCVIKDFNDSAFQTLVSEEEVRRNIQVQMEVHTEEPSKRARQRLMQCLSDERDSILKTLNHYYSQNLEKCRMDRLKARMERAMSETRTRPFRPNDGYPAPQISLESAMSAAQLSNEGEAVNNIHDALKAYYKVSIKRFTDNVAVGPVEGELLGKSGLVKTFSQRFVTELSDEQLKNIAEETSMTSMARADAEANVERMQKALDLARGLGV